MCVVNLLLSLSNILLPIRSLPCYHHCTGPWHTSYFRKFLNSCHLWVLFALWFYLFLVLWTPQLMGFCSSNDPDLCLEAAWFEYWPVHRLSRLQIVWCSPVIRLRPLSSKLFPCHHSSVILQFYAIMYSELLTASFETQKAVTVNIYLPNGI
jgi:hypothetical protein